MSLFTRLRVLRLKYLSRPSGERVLYRAIWRQQPQQIVELGMATGQRTERMLRLAQLARPEEEITYAGVDLFESREADQPGMTLKQAHCLCKGLTSSVQLLPGDPYSALARGANSLGDTDLLIIGADQQGESLQRAWFYVPRMLNDDSQVFLEEPNSSKGPQFRRLTRFELEQHIQAAQPARMRRAA